MIVLNLFGGPGVGKSTVAAMLFAHYKRRGYRVELAREQAKELQYQGRDLARNQILLMAMQYQVLRDLQEAGTDLAICDSALRLQLVYCKHLPYYETIATLVGHLVHEFGNVDVLLNRAVPYQCHGRDQTEAEARMIDAQVYGYFDISTDATNPAGIIADVDSILIPRLERSR